MGTFFGFEVDRIYATIPGLSGSDLAFEGAILDGYTTSSLHTLAWSIGANIR
ncbi:MAG: hypothetical protein Q8Q09_23965 [Deltaproteobacteria bacterium]|nr:hypothetical protein [Deltaproteobacteria bacterium]